MKVGRKFWVVALTLVIAGLVVGCSDISREKKITIGATSWDESVAVSNLTKVLLEDELGYDRVELKTLDTASLFESVSSGDLDVFQAVRLPNHQRYLSSAQDEVELLDPWFQGTPRIGIAVPRYMNITSIPSSIKPVPRRSSASNQMWRFPKKYPTKLFRHITSNKGIRSGAHQLCSMKSVSASATESSSLSLHGVHIG